MSWRKRVEREVQARTDSTVYSNSTPMHLSKVHLSPSRSESEPEHLGVRAVAYEPVISKADLMELISTGERYWRVKN